MRWSSHRGRALIEVASAEDRQVVTAPAGIEVTWLIRHTHTTPGRTALAAAMAAPLPD